jgi:uncharacterized repeat protein (TIGR03803 family)
MNHTTVSRKRNSGTMALATLPVLFALLIAVRPTEAQTETVLYNFCSQQNCSDGAAPSSRLTADGAGNLYGSTQYGGLGYGTVFELSPNGNGGWNETVLYSFTGGSDGAYPLSYVIFDSGGNLYGTAIDGGTNGYGAVFELSPSGTSWTETVLYSFCSQPSCADGANPLNGLIMDAAGNLYGTTNGSVAEGTVFELSLSHGTWREQVIYSVGVDNIPGLAMDAAGNIYGTSTSALFELSPNGHGGWTSTVLHTFAGSPKDGSFPEGAPALDQAGNIYGATYSGGVKNNGTVYEVKHGKKQWKEKVLHSLKGGKRDGANPYSGVVLDAAGNTYGTTPAGGKSNAGTVYELVAPVGKGRYTEKLLWNFSGPDGYSPFDSLILDNAGNLYGVAGGGSTGAGVVFEVTP